MRELQRGRTVHRMKFRLRFIAFALLAAFTSPLGAQPPKADAIAKLVDNLAHADFAVRDDAQRRLAEIGPPARPFLEKAAKSSDAEQKMRAEEILRDLKSTDFWVASTVTLKRANAPAVEVLREIANQTGNPFDEKASKGLADKKLSVDWKQKTYWQALDEVSKTTGVGQKIEDSSSFRGIVFSAEERTDYPTAYEGPVRLRLAYTKSGTGFRGRRNDWSDTTSLDIHFEMHWEPKIVLCRYLTRLKVLEAVTDQNESLVFRNFGPPPSPMHVTQKQHEVSYRTSLRATRQAQPIKLAKFRVETTLVAAGDFARLEVPVEPGKSARESGYLLEFIRLEPQQEGGKELTFALTRPAPSDAINAADLTDEFFTLLDKDGKPITYSIRQVIGDRAAVRYSVLVQKVPPAKVSFQFAKLRNAKRFEFGMTDVPLSTVEP